MKKHLLKLLTISLAIFLSGCRTNLYHQSEQCSPVFVYADESKEFIDAQESFCSVRQYEFGINHVGPIEGTSSKRPIDYCDRCVGFKEYADVATFWEQVRRAVANDEGSEGFIGEIAEPAISSRDFRELSTREENQINH